MLGSKRPKNANFADSRSVARLLGQIQSTQYIGSRLQRPIRVLKLIRLAIACWMTVAGWLDPQRTMMWHRAAVKASLKWNDAARCAYSTRQNYQRRRKIIHQQKITAVSMWPAFVMTTFDQYLVPHCPKVHSHQMWCVALLCDTAWRRTAAQCSVTHLVWKNL